MGLQLFKREQGAQLESGARSRRGFLRGFGAVSAGAAVTATLSRRVTRHGDFLAQAPLTGSCCGKSS